MNFFKMKLLFFNPLPKSINLWWNMGFLLSLGMILQSLSGLLLTLFFSPNWDLSFESLLLLIRWQQWNWIIQLIHFNNASFIFMLIFCHIFRGLTMFSYLKVFKVWNIGMIMMIFLMLESFLGYVLPWGQMSLWGATVITNFVSAFPLIGEKMLLWIRSNFMIDKDTLNRFFSAHYLIPFIIIMMMIMHMFFLHEKGSSNQMSTISSNEKISLFPYFLVKDFFLFFMSCFFYMTMILIYSHSLGDSENFSSGNYEKTPEKIQPEWYFLFSYAILRSFPEKLSGILGMLMSLLVFMFISFKNYTNYNFFFIKKKNSFFIILWFMILTFEGANHASIDTILSSQVMTSFYFLSFFMH